MQLYYAQVRLRPLILLVLTGDVQTSYFSTYGSYTENLDMLAALTPAQAALSSSCTVTPLLFLT